MAEFTGFQVFLVIIGLLCHMLKQLVTAQRNGKIVCFKQYWIKHWMEAALAVCGSVGLFAIGLEMDSMNSLNAIAAGFMGNSLADVVGKRSNLIGK